MATYLYLKDNGGLASLTISSNKIGSDQQAKIKQICAGKSIECTLYALLIIHQFNTHQNSMGRHRCLS